MTQENTAVTIEPQASGEAAIDALLRSINEPPAEEAAPAPAPDEPKPAAPTEEPPAQAEKPAAPEAEAEPIEEPEPDPILDRLPAAKAAMEKLSAEERAALADLRQEYEAAVHNQYSDFDERVRGYAASQIQAAETVTAAINNLTGLINGYYSRGALNEQTLAGLIQSPQAIEALRAAAPVMAQAEAQKIAAQAAQEARESGFDEAVLRVFDEGVKELNLPPSARREIGQLLKSPLAEGEEKLSRLPKLAKALYDAGRREGRNVSAEAADLTKKVESRVGQGPAAMSGVAGSARSPQDVLDSPNATAEDKARAFEELHGVKLETP